jgi:hypothetical protein
MLRKPIYATLLMGLQLNTDTDTDNEIDSPAVHLTRHERRKILGWPATYQIP